MLQGFKKFILRGNAVDLAVGVVIGAAFQNIISSLVKDMITPIISAVFTTPDFSSLSFTINGSKFMYGDFINSVIAFLIIAFVVYFFVITPINALAARVKKGKPEDPTNKKCPECLSEIPLAAKRCAFCTSVIA